MFGLDKFREALRLLKEYNEEIIIESQYFVWNQFSEIQPQIGESVLVRSITGEIKYAIYSNLDVFDVHSDSTKLIKSYRVNWFKFSSSTFPHWYPISSKKYTELTSKPYQKYD